jgi:hypothetical protein
MQITTIDVESKQVTIQYMNKQRVVSFNDAGDIDVEPYDDLSEEEGQELFDRILNNQSINAAIPFDD